MSSKPLNIFFSGIAGSGVSAIACFMADKGHHIAGSDRVFDNFPVHPLFGLLTSKGVTVLPQNGTGINDSFDFAVFSTAVEHDNPEFLKAKSLGLTIKTRPEYLAEIVLNFRTAAVAGTSGKSTTSGMLAFLMQRLGLHPNFIGGGRVKQFKSGLNAGNSITGDSDLLVIEACESDGTIANYKPEQSILLNLELDHHSVEETAGLFKALAKNTGGAVVINADDMNLRQLDLGNRTVAFSVDESSDIRPLNVNYRPFGTDFLLNGVEFILSIPGKYNLYNALSCIALLYDMGFSLNQIADVLHEFKGIERRFDIYLNNGKGLVIDDYAHNPHKIAAFMQTMSRIRESICYVFQPHGFGPTKMMMNEYIEAFAANMRDSDQLILLPIFYAGGTAMRDISSRNLADGVKSMGRKAEVVDDRESLLIRIGAFDCYAVLGARDDTLAGLASKIAQLISLR